MQDNVVVPVNEPSNPNLWRSCCLTVDKQMVQYITQCTMLFGVAIFSGYMVATNDACSNGVYLSLLSSTLSIFLPSPSMKK